MLAATLPRTVKHNSLLQKEMLCRVCKDTFEGTWDSSKTTKINLSYLSNDNVLQEPSYRSYGHHRDWSSVEKSATEGCVVCRRIHESSNAAEEKSHGYHSCFGFDRNFDRDYDLDGTICFDVLWGSSWTPTRLIPLKDPYAARLNFYLDLSTDSDSSWDIAMAWLNKCVDTHDAARCLRNQTPNFFPTRLLELKRSGSQLMFSLVLRKELPSGVSYMTLSHCWGKGDATKKLKLLRSTIDELREMHPIASLPKTFREACQVTERLGVRYLWIDRLCIIQDYEEDWNREAALMQDVYKNSFLNISAHGAGDDEEGLFFNRDPRRVDFSVIDIRFQSPTQPEYFILDWDIREGWEGGFKEGPVVSRGWIIQERLLAPRVLHFGRKQLFWECNSLAGCESRPHGLRIRTSPGWNPNSPHIWKKLLDTTNRLHGRGPLEQAFLDWNGIVANYSKCQVTLAKDRLVAISGLANDMKRKLRELGCEDTSYFAGLWAANLPLGLVWFSNSRASRPSQYRAPSWSWASIEGPVIFCGFPLTGRAETVFYASFIRAEVNTRGGPDTGQVSYGKMVLRGHLALGELAYRNRKQIERFRDIEDPTRTLTPAERVDTGRNSSRTCDRNIMFDTEDKFGRSKDELNEVYCLPILAQKTESTYWEIVFLVLTRKDQDFTRIGYLEIYANNHDDFHNRFQQFPERTIEIV